MANIQYKKDLLNVFRILTFGVKALSDPVFPKHHIHPLPMAAHKQSHPGQGGLSSWPHHLRQALQSRVRQHSIPTVYTSVFPSTCTYGHFSIVHKKI